MDISIRRREPIVKRPIKSSRWPKRAIDTFFDKWSADSSYILGFFAADGCMYKNKKNSYYISFYSADKELIYSVKKN